MQPFNKFNVASLLWKHGRGAVGILGPVEENIAAELNEMVAQELEATPARDADGIQLPQAARVTVSDDMVKRAMLAWHDANKMYRNSGEVRPFSAMRAALTAALTGGPTDA
jgi:type II secretory pathway component PulK